MKKGIYLVANYKSQDLCKNLIYSIRSSGCSLPIRLIHFGGKEISLTYISDQVEFWRYEDFPIEAKDFIRHLKSVLTDCPEGYLYRFAPFFMDWEEFIYSDNDIVALYDWSYLFSFLAKYDVVHADEEYKTNGKFNYKKPLVIKERFGEFALESSLTAGHITVKRSEKTINDLYKAIKWFQENPDIPKKHDQSFLHIASLIGNWKLLNLCRTKNWLSSWSGDYKNALQLVHQIQKKNSIISHIHYSGGKPNGTPAIHELLLSVETERERMKRLFVIVLKYFTCYEEGKTKIKKLRNLWSI